jgi:hypothetical protein
MDFDGLVGPTIALNQNEISKKRRGTTSEETFSLRFAEIVAAADGFLAPIVGIVAE